MKFEKPIIHSHPDRSQPEYTSHELRNMEVIEQILVSGTDEEMHMLCTFHNIDREHCEQARYFSRMRDTLIKQSRDGYLQRMKDGPAPDIEERSAGLYREMIEEPARNAVFMMRQKGYPTYASGFIGFDGGQHIAIDKPLFPPLKEDVQRILEQRYAITFQNTSTRIQFIPQHRLSVQDIMAIYDAIAEALPDLGEPAPDVKRPYWSQGHFAKKKKPT
jgi:hypothetical protein